MPDRPEKSVLAPYRAKLGKVPDQQIADLAKVSRTLVVNYRKKLGISAYQGHKAAASPQAPRGGDTRPFRGRRSALDAYADKLGSVPDAEIARLAGVTAENVRTYRRRRNIPAAWQQDGAEAGEPVAEASTAKRSRAPREAVAARQGAPAAASPAAPVATHTPAVGDTHAEGAPGAGTAYLVTVDTHEGTRTYALVALDIAAAAVAASSRVAARHPGATIRSIQRVAEVFTE